MDHLLAKQDIEKRPGDKTLQQKCLILENFSSWTTKFVGLQRPENCQEVLSEYHHHHYRELMVTGHWWSRSYAVLYVLTRLIPTKACEAGSLIPFKDEETEYRSWDTCFPVPIALCQLQWAQEMLYAWMQQNPNSNQQTAGMTNWLLPGGVKGVSDCQDAYSWQCQWQTKNSSRRAGAASWGRHVLATFRPYAQTWTKYCHKVDGLWWWESLRLWSLQIKGVSKRTEVGEGRLPKGKLEGY